MQLCQSTYGEHCRCIVCDVTDAQSTQQTDHAVDGRLIVRTSTQMTSLCNNCSFSTCRVWAARLCSSESDHTQLGASTRKLCIGVAAAESSKRLKKLAQLFALRTMKLI